MCLNIKYQRRSVSVRVSERVRGSACISMRGSVRLSVRPLALTKNRRKRVCERAREIRQAHKNIYQCISCKQYVGSGCEEGA